MPLVYIKPQRRHQTYSGGGAYKRSTRGKPRKAGGQGAYSIDDGPWANAGARIGAAIGNPYNMGGIGSWIGRRLLHYPAKLFGSGAYRKKKTAKGGGSYDISNGSTRLAPEIPRFEKDGDDDSIVISHREYIGDIFTSGTANTFSVQEFNLNPGDPVSFPWLSTVAQTSYQQFKFSGCIFQFVSTSSDALNSTNTALGAVIACVNYDSNDPPFTSRMQMENTSWANCCKPSEGMPIPVECAARMTSMQGLLYVSQNGVLPAGADPKTYYLGKVSIATTGFQGTNINIGSLYVTYKVKLYKPIMLPPLSNANRMNLNRTGATSAAPFGTATSVNAGSDCDTLGVEFTSGTVMTIPKSRLQVGQRFFVILEWSHSSGAATTATVSQSTNMSSYAYFGTNSGFGSIPWPTPAGTTVTDSGIIFNAEVNNDNADWVITLSAATLPANAVLNINIVQICGMPSSRLGVI